ncbi:uncharacterized protein LOC126879735 [Diabrotica virgifera virgifera]|uniref:Uncharacterized protein n=1 Tax=Diabrotica virgifera virgifera TaxID=50390 RepID=A0ABM5JLU3_DIAVI|nr:uncharacterized protein LOC126879735 [Diabrotica virgifera virgifera]
MKCFCKRNGISKKSDYSLYIFSNLEYGNKGKVMCIPHCLTFSISLVSGHHTIQILPAMIGSNAEQELNLESPRKRIGVQNKKVYKGQQTSSISDQNCITEIQEIDSAPPLEKL